MKKKDTITISKVEYNSLLLDSLELRIVQAMETSKKYLKEIELQKPVRSKRTHKNVKQTTTGISSGS